MGKRVQLTVPDEVVAAWQVRAAKAGVSLGSWVVAQVQRDELDQLTAEVMKRLDVLDRRTLTIVHAQDAEARSLESISNALMLPPPQT